MQSTHTANNFGLLYSRKRISQNSFPNFLYIFPKSFMIFCQELSNPKQNYENQIWTRLPRMSCHHEKVINVTPWNWTQAPCITGKYFATGPSKLIWSVPTKLIMSRSQLREQICQTSKSDRQEWQSLVVLNGTILFLKGTNISFLKFICGILNRGVANSFWNHMIQISSRQM